jgi:CRISPR-associated endonuclease/helicase Cas3
LNHWPTCYASNPYSYTHNHDTDPISDKRVSIGLIRLANISTIYPLAQALYAQDAPDGVQLHLCVYHAQYLAAALCH